MSLQANLVRHQNFFQNSSCSISSRPLTEAYGMLLVNDECVMHLKLAKQVSRGYLGVLLYLNLELGHTKPVLGSSTFNISLYLPPLKLYSSNPRTPHNRTSFGPSQPSDCS